MNALTPAIDRIVITPGEPAGIGPDLCIQLAREASTDSERIVIADPLLLLERAAQLGMKVAMHAHGASGINDGLRAGVDTIEHASLADEESFRLAKANGAWFSMDIYDDDYILAEGAKNGMYPESLEKERAVGLKQRQVFRAHVEAARRTGLPLVVHTRDADEDMIQILESEYESGAYKLLLHCYTSGADLARRAAALGSWFSVSGIATFKAAQEVRDIIADMPADRIIVETDCPYLAPVLMRGRRNEPAFLPHVLAKLAEIRGWTPEDAEQRTEDAFFALFDRIPRP